MTDTVMEYATRKRIIDFLEELLCPDGYGYAVTSEVRAHALRLLAELGERK